MSPSAAATAATAASTRPVPEAEASEPPRASLVDRFRRLLGGDAAAAERAADAVLEADQAPATPPTATPPTATAPATEAVEETAPIQPAQPAEPAQPAPAPAAAAAAPAAPAETPAGSTREQMTAAAEREAHRQAHLAELRRSDGRPSVTVGCIARDTVTQFMGVVIARTEHLGGRVTYTLQRRIIGHDDRPVEETFDDFRLYWTASLPAASLSTRSL